MKNGLEDIVKGAKGDKNVQGPDKRYIGPDAEIVKFYVQECADTVYNNATNEKYFFQGEILIVCVGRAEAVLLVHSQGRLPVVAQHGVEGFAEILIVCVGGAEAIFGVHSQGRLSVFYHEVKETLQESMVTKTTLKTPVCNKWAPYFTTKRFKIFKTLLHVC